VVGGVEVIAALLRKETEALAPYWLAFAVLAAANLLSGLWDPSFVLDGLGARFSSGVGNAGTLWVLSFLVGHGAVAHELREGHVEFLDALPVGRWAVFLAKLAACVLPVLALVAASLAMDLFLVAAIRPPASLSPVQPVLTMHLVMLGSGLSGLGVGMLLSWVGPLAWGVLGLAMLIGLCANVVYPPIDGWLPLIGSFGALEWEGTSASHPVAPPLAFTLLGVFGVAASGLLFLGPGRVLTERGSTSVAAVRFSLLGCLALLVAPLGLLAAVMVLLQHGGVLLAGKRALRSDGGDFRILYAPGSSSVAREVAARIDPLAREVGALMGNPSPLRLDVELLGAPANHLGVFTGGKIRLTTSPDEPTLAHELAHAHAFALTGPGGAPHQHATHFFDEGLADWVQARVSGEDPVPRIAGLIYETGQARFEDLVDHPRHLARHDIRQSYVLGQVFVEALVQVGGPEAPACVLRELGRLGSRPMAGLAVWYGLAERCDLDLDAVQDRWRAELEAARARFDGPVPRLRVAVVAAHDSPDGRARLEVRDERDLGWELLCGFRSGPDDAVHRWVYIPAWQGACRVPTESLSGHTVQYQVGYRMPGSGDGPPSEVGLEDVYLEWTDLRRE
jgi:hypothetical protein